MASTQRDIVTLKVGGTTFMTTTSTLTKYPSSYFSKLLSEAWVHAPAMEEMIFIDRSPTLFEHVLHFLRCGDAWVVPDGSALQKRLLHEFAFYNLPIEQLESKQSEAQADVVNFNVGGKLFSTDRATLMKYPHCKLANMAQEQRTPRDRDGNIWVDRSRRVFENVLELLRNGETVLNYDTCGDHISLGHELTWYEIPYKEHSEGTFSTV